MSTLEERLLQLETDVLSANDAVASDNRRQFSDEGILALNLVSSPGSGKTTLLCETIKRLKSIAPIGVIEGDQQTANDANRIRQAGAPAIQINTGDGCHLEAAMIKEAVPQLALKRGSVLFIENVGNLVCPAAYDLGEDCKVVVLSVTEGDDKPLKYPNMFAASRLMIINKMDLLPYVDFDPIKCREYAERVSPGIDVIEVSATTGLGMDLWCDWIAKRLIP